MSAKRTQPGDGSDSKGESDRAANPPAPEETPAEMTDKEKETEARFTKIEETLELLMRAVNVNNASIDITNNNAVHTTREASPEIRKKHSHPSCHNCCCYQWTCCYSPRPCCYPNRRCYYCHYSCTNSCYDPCRC